MSLITNMRSMEYEVSRQFMNSSSNHWPLEADTNGDIDNKIRMNSNWKKETYIYHYLSSPRVPVVSARRRWGLAVFPFATNADDDGDDEDDDNEEDSEDNPEPPIHSSFVHVGTTISLGEARIAVDTGTKKQGWCIKSSYMVKRTGPKFDILMILAGTFTVGRAQKFKPSRCPEASLPKNPKPYVLF